MTAARQPDSLPRHRRSILHILARRAGLFFLLAANAFAAPGKSRPQKSQQPFELRIERNAVQVRVVVRDKHGQPIRNLTKDDFLLFDNGKPQAITNFSIVKAKGAAVPAAKLPGTSAAHPPKPAKIPKRFVALLFDDLNMNFEQVAWVRKAAGSFLDTSLSPGDRVGLFTTSGQDEVGFTADRAKLHKALLRILPQGFLHVVFNECPALTDYEAFSISEYSDALAPPNPDEDAVALQVATREVVQCYCQGGPCPMARQIARSRALRDWAELRDELPRTVDRIRDVVRRVSVLPGERSLVLVSPGFISTAQWSQINEIINHAVRAGVVINSLDSRGLWALVPGGDASRVGRPLPARLAGQKIMMQTASAVADQGVLQELAAGTGGIFFHDNNDYLRGFRETGGRPETSYLLVFSPRNLRRDGKYHKLKVKLAKGVGHWGWSLEARKGYFAPGPPATSAQQVRQAIDDLVFSQDSVEGLPIQVETRLAQSGSPMSELTVVTHLDARTLDFVAKGNRNVDTVKFVTVVFDENGNYVNGMIQTVQFHLRDPSFKMILAQGLAVPMKFQLPPGTYLVRIVVRDSNGTLAAASRTVQAGL